MDVHWQAEVKGEAAVRVLRIDDESVYVSDGWGVAFAALRLRRLSLANGDELATARLGNQARCVAWAGAELLAATDTKIFRLDPLTLDETAPRWDRRVPRFTDMLCELDGRLVLTNWTRDSCAVIDPAGWRVRRARPGPYPALVETRTALFVFSRGTGRLSRLDANDDRVRLEVVAEGPAGLDIAYDEREAAFWILEGTPAFEVRTAYSASIEPGRPSDMLRRVSMDGSEVPLRLDRLARRLALDSNRRRLWTIDDAATVSIYDLVTLELIARHEVRRDNTHIVSVDPSANIVVTATAKPPTPTTTLTCLVMHAA
jgi:hypothetical protein